MSKFKAGDLALTLVDTLTWPAMTVVELHTFHLPGALIEQCKGIRRTSVAVWECVSAHDDKYAYLYYPHTLMPLRGDFQPEQELTRELTQ